MKHEFRDCFKCNYQAVTDAALCPRCRHKLHTQREIRLFGLMSMLCGGLIAGIIGAVAVFVGLLVTQPEKWGARLTARHDPQLIAIFGVLALVFALGLTFMLAGVWQIIFARRNKFLIRAALVLIFVVFGGAEIFVAFTAQGSEFEESAADKRKHRELKAAENDSKASEPGKTPDAAPINDLAVSLPKPVYPPAARVVKAGGEVRVRVEVDAKGKVVSARAVSGHPLLWASAESAARGAKFKPSAMSGILVFTFTPQ